MKTPRKIDTAEALERVRLISPRLLEDVGTALLSSVIFNAANDTIPKGLGPVYSPVERAYLGVQNALSLKLAMDLARIFDLSEGYPADAQDKASIPVLAALLTRPDVQDGLLQEDAKRIAGVKIDRSVDTCQKAITDFLPLAQGLGVKNSEENVALVRIRQFRNPGLPTSYSKKSPIRCQNMLTWTSC